MRKKMRNLFLAIATFGFFTSALAQEKFTISGYIRDAETGEELIGATVAQLSLNKGTLCNMYGYYSLTLPAGKHTINISFIGYESEFKEIDLNANMSMNFAIMQKSLSIQEIVVSAAGVKRNVESTEMSVAKLSVQEISTIPILFGEKDILKTLQLLPGVSAAGV